MFDEATSTSTNSPPPTHAQITPFLEHSLESMLILGADRSSLSTPPLPSPTTLLTPMGYRDTQSILWDSQLARHRYQEERKEKYFKISQRSYSTTGRRWSTDHPSSDHANPSTIASIPRNPPIPIKDKQTQQKFTSISISVQHDQLRSLLHSPNAHSIIYPNWGNLWEWDPVGCGNPRMIVEGRRYLGDGHRISTCYADANHCIMGGFLGEMVTIQRSSGSTVKQDILSSSSNPILTKITKHENDFIVSINDGQVIFTDLEHPKRVVNVGSSCNVATMVTPSLLAVGMDVPEVPLLDIRTENEVVLSLKGHQGSIFDVSPVYNNVMTTCGDDYTCHFWDLRRPDRPLRVVGSQMSPFRTMRRNADSSYLAIMEDCDYVTIVDMATFECGIVDFFGETAGLCWSGDDVLHIGCSDLHLGGIITVSM